MRLRLWLLVPVPLALVGCGVTDHKSADAVIETGALVALNYGLWMQ